MNSNLENFSFPLTSNQNWYNMILFYFLKSFIWSSMDDSKDDCKNNYLILKLNYVFL